MNTLKKLVVACICTSIIYACGGGQKQNTSEKESNKDLERVENISVDVTDDCIQVYENSFCRATTANIDGVDYMVVYRQHEMERHTLVHVLLTHNLYPSK